MAPKLFDLSNITKLTLIDIIIAAVIYNVLTRVKTYKALSVIKTL